MSRKSRMQSLRESKDKRAKRMAIGGAVVLAVLLAWEVPHYLGKKSPASQTATTSASATTPATTTPGAPAPAAAPAGAAAAAAVVPTGSSRLPNTDVTPRAGKSQLAAFSEFPSKDPFVQQVSVPSGSPGSSATGAAPAPASSPASSPSAPSAPVQAASVRTLARGGVATISVNGKTEVVRVGGSFPSSNPVFKLVSLSNGGAQIGIANGSYANGAQTISLTSGKTLTLVDTADGARYHLRLLSGS